MERIRRARDPSGLTVVTSDRQVIATARDRGARVVRAEAFVGQLGPSPAPEDAGKPDATLSPEQVDEWLELFDEKGS
jgi:hypothetical protein